MNVKEHYDKHLANFYSWMLGDLDSKINDFKDFLLKHEIKPTSTKTAIDLGAGNGVQSIALQELEFKVTALDFNQQLLNELKSNPRAGGIDTQLGDIRQILKFKALKPELIICAGDTITHLESKGELKQLLKDIQEVLVGKGILILTFRDYSTELDDQTRFIPVKSSDDKILTCILEYQIEKVKVTDLLYEKINDEWQQKVSSYEKLRIAPQEVMDLIQDKGMKVKFHEVIKRMQVIIAEK